MKPGDQRLLHVANAVATVLVTGIAAIGWGRSTALQAGFGALVATTSVAVIGLVVWVITSPHGKSGLGALALSFGILLQVFGVGAVIWYARPETMPFGAGVAAVLGSVVLAALIDGVRVSRGEPEFEELSFPDGWPKDEPDEAAATTQQTESNDDHA